MPGITNPAEEYFKDGLWGWASTVWEKLISSGGILYNALHGWDGDSWQKLPMLWGYSDVWRAVKNATNVDAGNADISYTALGAGEVVVVTSFCLRCSQSNAARIELKAVIDGSEIILKCAPLAAAYQDFSTQGPVILTEGDYLRFYYNGATALDDFYSYASGYKMKIAE